MEELRQNRRPIEKATQDTIKNNSNTESVLPVTQEKIEQKSSNKVPPPPPPPPFLLNVPPPPPPLESFEAETVGTVSKNDPDFLKKLIEQRSVHRVHKKGNRRATEPSDKFRSNVDGKQGRSQTVPEKTTGKNSGPSRLSRISESDLVEGEDPTSKTAPTNTVGEKVKSALQKLTFWRKT